MRDVLRWDPFRELEAAPAGDYGLFSPSFDVKENKDGYVFRADLPGVREEDLDISLTGNRLTISGKREQEKHEQGDTYYASERSYGSFSRAFTLPDGTDGENVKADLKNGVLQVIVPKKPEVQPRRSRSARKRAAAARRRPDADDGPALFERNDRRRSARFSSCPPAADRGEKRAG